MPRLYVERGNEKGAELLFRERDGAWVIGRSNRCDLVLTDFLVSRRHFHILRKAGLVTVEDLRSHNGTFVNGARISGETMLCPGDTLRAGETLFSFLADDQGTEGVFAGRKLGDYHVQSRLGVGGMGEVYRALQTSLGRTVAIKILSPELTTDRTFVERFMKEAQAAGKLSHPNVVSVHEVGVMNETYFYSMEYVDGGSVQELISRRRRLDPEQAAEIVLQAAKALEYAEKIGLVHCDIKPDNLMLTKDGEVRLADLGIAKMKNAKGKADQADGVFGSPHYMAPEQARGLPLDNRADIYSLGVTFYRLLAGRVPFTGKDARSIMEKQVFSDPPPLRRYAPEISPRLASLVTRMMRKKPQERPQTATRIIKELEEMLPLLRAEAHGHKTWNENDPEARVTADAREEGEVHLDSPLAAPIRSGRRYRGRLSVWGSIGGFLLMLILAAVVMVSTGYLAYRFAFRSDQAAPAPSSEPSPESPPAAEGNIPSQTETVERKNVDDIAEPVKKEAVKKKRTP
jgi:serine/threonine protein kinase